MIFGGEKEVTQSTISNDTRVAGVISEEPAYLMNSGSVGQPIGRTVIPQLPGDRFAKR